MGSSQCSCYTVLTSCQLEPTVPSASIAVSTGRLGRTPSATFERPWENFSTQLLTALHNKHLPPQTGNISLCLSFALSLFCPQTKTLLFDSVLLKHGHHLDNWNQALNMRMRVCYLDCREAWLCCYLVTHTENLLLPLQLFYLLTLPL
jgi:hypothetical protein